MSKNKNTKSSLKYADICGDLDGFVSESDRIKFLSKQYKGRSVSRAFADFYGIEIHTDKEEERFINTIANIEVGGRYFGTVASISKSGITFAINGVKEEVISKENFNDCMDNIQNYLLNHDNKLCFEVREKVNGKFIVSVINAYYSLWFDKISKAIDREEAIPVHIDELTKGGYLCHTTIDTLYELTGKNYTSSVFIPGSNIVLNIEHDFEQWVGQDVEIIPQKFVKYRNVGPLTENSLIGSRKKVLMIKGFQNIYDIYQRDLLAKKSAKYVPEVFDGVVTGIINSNKKTGCFVELSDKYITGLMPLDPLELVNFKPGDHVRVTIEEFEVQEGREPFEMTRHGKLKKCNTRLVFAQA